MGLPPVFSIQAFQRVLVGLRLELLGSFLWFLSSAFQGSTSFTFPIRWCFFHSLDGGGGGGGGGNDDDDDYYCFLFFLLLFNPFEPHYSWSLLNSILTHGTIDAYLISSFCRSQDCRWHDLIVWLSSVLVLFVLDRQTYTATGVVKVPLLLSEWAYYKSLVTVSIIHAFVTCRRRSTFSGEWPCWWQVDICFTCTQLLYLLSVRSFLHLATDLACLLN